MQRGYRPERSGDDSGNVIRKVVNEVGYVMTIMLAVIVDVTTSTVETIAGLYRHLSC